ncbi:MAG TPA: peptidylprolyl isomerase [Ruminiclostridium sp.]|nr:peptidylprolyl isomerase [Ruminiclostridium sp.]
MYRRLLNALMVIALVLTSLIPANTYAAATKTATDQPYVATVGTDKITVPEFRIFLEDAVYQVQSYFNSYDVDWTAKIQNMTASEYAKKTALSTAVDYKIQLSKAKAAKISLTKKELDDFNSKMDSYLKSLAATVQDQEKAIKEQTGFTLAEFKSFYKDAQLVRKLATTTQNKYKSTDAELTKYYNSDKYKFYKVVVGHILFVNTDENGQPSAEKDAEAKKKAEETLIKVNAPKADFAALAKELSEDPGSKDSGGEYTVMKNNQYVPEFQNWAVDPARKVGDTGIVKTSYGYHVMKLIKIYSFAELKNDIKSGYITQKYDNDLSTWRKDKKYKVTQNQAVYNSIKVP